MRTVTVFWLFFVAIAYTKGHLSSAVENLPIREFCAIVGSLSILDAQNSAVQTSICPRSSHVIYTQTQ